MSIETEEEPSERELVALLAPVYRLRCQRDNLAEAYVLARKPIADFLLRQPDGYRLVDGESGVAAWYASGGDEHKLDFDELLESDVNYGWRVLAWLASHGCLRLDWQTFQRQKENGAEGAVAERYITKQPRTRSLRIDKQSRRLREND